MVYSFLLTRTVIPKSQWHVFALCPGSHIPFDSNLSDGRISIEVNIKAPLMHLPDIYILVFATYFINGKV